MVSPQVPGAVTQVGCIDWSGPRTLGFRAMPTVVGVAFHGQSYIAKREKKILKNGGEESFVGRPTAKSVNGVSSHEILVLW